MAILFLLNLYFLILVEGQVEGQARGLAPTVDGNGNSISVKSLFLDTGRRASRRASTGACPYGGREWQFYFC